MESKALYNLILREWLNGSLLPLSLSLSLIIGVFLFNTWLASGGGWQWRWTEEKGIKVSCAFFWLFAYESVRAGTVWVLLRIANDGQRVTEWLDSMVNIAFVVGAAGLAVTFLRCCYLFTPESWGHRYWIGTLIFTIVFLVLSEMLPPFPLPHK